MRKFEQPSFAEHIDPESRETAVNYAQLREFTEKLRRERCNQIAEKLYSYGMMAVGCAGTVASLLALITEGPGSAGAVLPGLSGTLLFGGALLREKIAELEHIYGKAENLIEQEHE